MGRFRVPGAGQHALEKNCSYGEGGTPTAPTTRCSPSTSKRANGVELPNLPPFGPRRHAPAAFVLPRPGSANSTTATPGPDGRPVARHTYSLITSDGGCSLVGRWSYWRSGTSGEGPTTWKFDLSHGQWQPVTAAKPDRERARERRGRRGKALPHDRQGICGVRYGQGNVESPRQRGGTWRDDRARSMFHRSTGSTHSAMEARFYVKRDEMGPEAKSISRILRLSLRQKELG